MQGADFARREARHVKAVFVGAGKVGFELARRLGIEGHDVVVIDHDSVALREVEENLDVMVVHGSGTSSKLLKQVGVQDAGLFVAVTESDEVNMVACMTAKHLGIPLTVARIRNHEAGLVSNGGLTYKDFGIDRVINAEEAVAYEITKLLKSPAATDVEYFADGKVQMLGFRVQEGSVLAGKTVKDARLTHATIGAILRDGNVIVPHGDTTIATRDEILVIGKTGVPTEAGWLTGSPDQVIRDITILGGGTIGYLIARFTERHRGRGLSVKIIERDQARCEILARDLKHTLVIQGDGINPEILEEENVGSSGSFIAVTGGDQTNLLAGFMAKRLGNRKVIAELQREEYQPIASSMGLDVTVTPRVIVASTILRLISKAKVASLALLKDGSLEVLELVVAPGCRVCSKPLKALDLPREVTVGAVIRGNQVIVPRGDTVPMPGDHMVIFTLPALVPALETFFVPKGKT